jgi:hypothetical protein
MGPVPFFHMSVLFKTGAPVWWPGLGAGRFTFGALRSDQADKLFSELLGPPSFFTCRFCSQPMHPFGAQAWGLESSHSGPFEPKRPIFKKRLMGPPPLFHMSVLFQTGAPFWWPGLGAGRLTFGTLRTDEAEQMF